MDREYQLKLAVDDNIGWCRNVCEAHDLDERISEEIWLNLRPSPRFYPNVITRKRGAQATVVKAIEELRLSRLMPGWGIKDSYADLDLSLLGFKPVIEANWYTCLPQAEPAVPSAQWTPVATARDLIAWEDAWSNGEPPADDRRIFIDALLNEQGVRFWQRSSRGAIREGFVSHQSTNAVGLSNWFSEEEKAQAGSRAAEAVCSLFPNQSVVFWSAEDATWSNVSSLGPLKVWISTE